MAALLPPLILTTNVQAQNRVAGEGRVARAAQVTGNTFYHYCGFDGPAKVDNYAIVSSMTAGKCHDSGISSKEPRPKQWKDVNGLYLGIIKEVEQVGDKIFGIIDIANVTAGWITDIGAKVSAPELAKQQLKDLKELAHKKGLRWRIHCLDNVRDPSKAFLAWAQYKAAPEFAVYIEDGARPEWGLRAASQEEAVRELYIAIQGAPNIFPDYKPAKHKPCPAPLEGE